MASEPKTRMLSLRISERQMGYLDALARRIRQTTGFRITRASIVLKLMEYGLPLLEEEFPPADSRPNNRSPKSTDS